MSNIFNQKALCPLYYKGRIIFTSEGTCYLTMPHADIKEMADYINSTSESGVIAQNGDKFYNTIVAIPGFLEHLRSCFSEELGIIECCITCFHVFLALRYTINTHMEEISFNIYGYIVDNVQEYGQWCNTQRL
jgi:hypothetical protein